MPAKATLPSTAYGGDVPSPDTPAKRAAIRLVAAENEKARDARQAETAAIGRRAKAIAAARKEGATLFELATVLGVTVERVRQMERA